MEKEKQSFRQKWFPTIGDAGEAADERGWEEIGAMVTLFGRWARTLAVSGIMLWGGYQSIGNNIDYSKGMRTGMINKFSERGLFWKTYEGQMALEGIVSGKNYVGANVWDFSLDRQAKHGENIVELTEKIRNYLEKGNKVKVDYIEQFDTWPWRSETNYLIQNVERVKEEKEQ